MIKHVLKHFGGTTKLAALLNVSTPAVSQWVSDGVIPPLRAIQIEQLSDGVFKAAELIEGSNNGN